MASMNVCKICGKKYNPCRSTELQSGVFRWRDVACCPDHGAEYFRLIKESRSAKKAVSNEEPRTNIANDSEDKANTLEPDRV